MTADDERFVRALLSWVAGVREAGQHRLVCTPERCVCSASSSAIELNEATLRLSDDSRADFGHALWSLLKPMRKGLEVLAEQRRGTPVLDGSQLPPERVTRAGAQLVGANWIWCVSCGETPVLAFDGHSTCASCKAKVAPAIAALRAKNRKR
jgi:hypothetical protein